MATINWNGNKKLRNTESVLFGIFNLPAVKTCPFATEHCKSACYAKKAENFRPNVLPCRERNFEDSKKNTFVPDIIAQIEKTLKSKKAQGKKVLFRIHESGDFYNKEYTNKWIQIAKHFENDNRIVFLAYTKSLLYVIQCGYGLSDFPKNLIIRSSLWDDTKAENLERTKTFDIPIYTAFEKKELAEKIENEKYTECECKDCGECQKCYKATEKRIAVAIH